MSLLDSIKQLFRNDSQDKVKKKSPYLREWTGTFPVTPKSCLYTLSLRRVRIGENISVLGTLPSPKKVEQYMALSGGPKRIWETLAGEYPTHQFIFSYTVSNPHGKITRVLIGDTFCFAATGFDSDSLAVAAYKFIFRLAQEAENKHLLLFSPMSQFMWAAALYKNYASNVAE